MSKSGNGPLWFPCGTGMHQEFGRNAAPPGTIYSCTNSRLDTSGVLVKRGGHVALTATVGDLSGNVEIQITGNGTTSHVEKAMFLTQINGQPCVATTLGAVFCMDTLSATNTFHIQGWCATCKPLRKRNGFIGAQINVSGGFGADPPAAAVNSAGYIIYAAIDADSVAHWAIENPDGVVIYRDILTTIDKVQLLAVGTAFYIIAQNGTDISAQALTPTGSVVTRGTLTSVGTLTGSSAHWDTSSYDGTNWFLIYQSAVGTLRLDKMTGTTSSANTTWAVTGTCPVSLWAYSGTGHVWAGYYNNPTVSGDVRYRVRAASNLAEVTAETTIVSGADVYGPPLIGFYRSVAVGEADDTNKAFFAVRYVLATGNTTRAIRWGTIFNDGTPVVLNSTPVWHVLPISKPDSFNRVWCLTDNADITLQRALLLRFSAFDPSAAAYIPQIELSSPTMAGAFGATYTPANSAMFFHAIAVGSSSALFAFPLIVNTVADAPTVKIEIYEYEQANQSQHLDTQRMGASTVAAGQPVEHAGKPASQLAAAYNYSSGGAEVGFLQAPVITATTIGTAGTTRTHSYRAVFEWSDAYGRRHRSPPSAPVSVTSADAYSIGLSVTTCEITQRRSSVISEPLVIFYRTLNGGTTYHRIGSTAGSDTSDGIVTTTDTLSDDAISDEEVLYTDGGVLDNTLAPPCRFLANSEDRLWCGGLWDPRVIQCSKVIIPEEPVQFTDSPTHQVTLLGECTGLAYMDGSIVAFTADEIYLISGDGPNDQGIGNFPPPRKLAQGIGCIDYRSVVETNIGTFFQSKRGIELLPRGFGPVEYVGRAVKDVFQSDSLTEVIASGVRMGPKDNTVRFMVKSAGGSSTTTVLVFDIDRGEWFRDTLSQASSCMGVWPDGFAWASTDFNSGTFTNPFLYENGSQNGDGPSGSTSYVAQTITWCRIYPFGSPVAWGAINKAQIVVESRGVDARITISLKTDENASQSPASPFRATATLGGEQHWREYVLPQSIRCSGVTVSLTDSAFVDADDGFKFIGVGLDVSSEGGIHLVNPSNNERA